MRDIVFYTFLFSCLPFILSVYSQPKKLYEFPFLYSIACVVFIVPTSFSLLYSWQIPDKAFILYFVNAILCFWSGILGYYSTPRVANKYDSLPTYQYDDDKILRNNLPFLMIGQLAGWYLSTLSVEGLWTGLPVYVLFFARFMRPAAIVAMLNYLRKPTMIRLIIILIWLVGPLELILTKGRRSEVAYMCITFLLPLFFIKRWVPSRQIIVPAAVFMFLVIVSFPALRTYTIEGNYQAALDVNILDVVDDHLNNESTNEIVEACLNVEAVYNSGKFAYGSGFYNQFIKQYIPRGIMGEDFKNGLHWNVDFDIDQIRREYGSKGSFKFYLAPTGFAQAFYEFGFFAFIPFFILGRISCHLFTKATHGQDLYNIGLYCIFAIFIPFAVYSTLIELPTLMLPLFFTIWFTIKKSRKLLTEATSSR